LNQIEAAEGYTLLQQKHGLSHEEIAERLGLDRSTVSNTLRLLRLPPEVQQMITKAPFPRDTRGRCWDSSPPRHNYNWRI